MSERKKNFLQGMKRLQKEVQEERQRREQLLLEIRKWNAQYEILYLYQKAGNELDQVKIPDYDRMGFSFSIDKENGFILVHSPE